MKATRIQPETELSRRPGAEPEPHRGVGGISDTSTREGGCRAGASRCERQWTIAKVGVAKVDASVKSFFSLPWVGGGASETPLLAQWAMAVSAGAGR